MDSRFGDFAATLFHSTSVSLDRALLSSEENEGVDRSVAKFLLLLSPFSSTKAAHRVIEYLIRKYHIERLNVNSLLDCCLLYHDTKWFLKLLQIANLDEPGSPWAFLKGYRQRGSPPGRHAFAERVAHDPNLLSFVGGMLFRSVSCWKESPTSAQWHSRVSFYSATVTAAVEAKQPSEDFLRVLLPQLLKGVALKAVPSLQVRKSTVVTLLWLQLFSSTALSFSNTNVYFLDCRLDATSSQ